MKSTPGQGSISPLKFLRSTNFMLQKAVKKLGDGQGQNWIELSQELLLSKNHMRNQSLGSISPTSIAERKSQRLLYQFLPFANVQLFCFKFLQKNCERGNGDSCMWEINPWPGLMDVTLFANGNAEAPFEILNVIVNGNFNCEYSLSL